MKYLILRAPMFRVKFVRHLATVTYLCQTYLITTFKVLYIENWPIYWISEFSYSPVSVSASAPKIPYGQALILTTFNIIFVDLAQGHFNMFTRGTGKIFEPLYLLSTTCLLIHGLPPFPV